MRDNIYDKSPLNYIGGKYRILPQIMTLFPTDATRLYDIFTGGCDVCANMSAKSKYAYDINNYVIDIYREFQKLTIEELLCYIDNTIRENKLTMSDKEAYLRFRAKYNATRNPLDLYVLVCYSFNYQFRFNRKHEYNNPFGKDRSSFNPVMRQNLIKFHANISKIQFTAANFKEIDYSVLGSGDFIYADPPYLITTGSYNDGKRGFEGWNEEDDRVLYEILDSISRQGAKFALSNVTEHKGQKNERLIAWQKKYNVHRIEAEYKNSNYHSQNNDKETHEVLVTNY